MKKTDNNITELVFILDRSGSMGGLESDTIGGYNALLEKQKEKYGWEFLFIGANIDAIATAKAFGISEDRSVNYRADSAGTNVVYQAMCEAVSSVRRGKPLAKSWSKPIEDDYKSRKK